jgi:tetratricopeptide (TPR) repeat protein
VRLPSLRSGDTSDKSFSVTLREKGPSCRLSAYQRALALRPDYPQALEYLGEAYVAMGKLDQARALLAKLELLDAKEASVLTRAIAQGGSAPW